MSEVRTRTDSRDPVEEGRDRLGELVQVAAGNEELPADTVERARAAVLSQFKQNQARGYRRKRTWVVAALGAAAFFAAAALLPVWRMAPRGGQPALLLSVVGTVTLDGATAATLGPGRVIPVGTQIETGLDGRFAMRMPSGSAVRLDVGSRLRLASASELELKGGAVYVDTGDDSGRLPDPVIIRTELGVARDIGTRFEARVEEGTLRIRVREGLVQVDGTAGSHEIESGTELSLDERGEVSRRQILPYGLAWDWLDGITPTIEIDGRPLRELLDWASRERGLQLTFADPATEEAASRIILSGTVEGLSPDEALQAMLTTCQMTRSVRRGILQIHSGLEPDG